MQEAEIQVPRSGYATDNIWLPPQSKNTDISDPLEPTASPVQIIEGYLTDDGEPPNGFNITGSGIHFPDNPAVGNFFLRVDFVPNRLFRFDGNRWIKVEDNIRSPLTPGTGNTLRDKFTNNTDVFTNDQGNTIPSMQSLGSFLKSKK